MVVTLRFQVPIDRPISVILLEFSLRRTFSGTESGSGGGATGECVAGVTGFKGIRAATLQPKTSRRRSRQGSDVPWFTPSEEHIQRGLCAGALGSKLHLQMVAKSGTIGY
jgi:hypothetical protein